MYNEKAKEGYLCLVKKYSNKSINFEIRELEA